VCERERGVCERERGVCERERGVCERERGGDDEVVDSLIIKSSKIVA